ncbi:MAG: hypothetical protein KDC05_08055 [Bacteroidales bacterium]|nr:hypothetical protein [Bacteroidales bacterium]
MKKLFKTTCLIVGLSILPFLLPAQNPPHPNGGGAPGSGNTPVGGGAPIGSGLIIMMVLGSAYGAKKTYDLKKS